MLADRVVFVVVAACAAHRGAQHRGEGGREHVIEGIVARLLDLVLGDLRRPHAGGDEPGGRERLVVVGSELIAGELPGHEAVVGHVLVEGLDDEVAVVEGVRPVVVLLVAMALGEARQVEPVPRPAFAEGRAGEQAIDQVRQRIRRAIGHECLHLRIVRG